MAEGTRSPESKCIEEALQQLRAKSDSQTRTLSELKEMIATMNHKYDQLVTRLGSHGDERIESSHNNTSRASTGRDLVQTRYAKVDFPRFDGENPRGWIYRCDKFFWYHHIAEGDKLYLATIHLEGPTIDWFQSYEASTKQFSWRKFSEDMVSRFVPDVYEDAVGQLTKLKQLSTVRAYQEQFEVLMGRTTGLPDEFFISCFTSGLKDEIRNSVLMFSPSTLSQAIGLARLQEETMDAMIRKARTPVKQTNNGYNTQSNTET